MTTPIEDFSDSSRPDREFLLAVLSTGPQIKARNLRVPGLSREAIQARVAAVLGVPAARVSVRGTSSNGMGFCGRGEGIAALAVVLLESV